MLAKSRISAIIITFLAMLPILIVEGFFQVLLPLLTGAPKVYVPPGQATQAALMLVFSLVIFWAFGAIMLYLLGGDKHFGLEGAARWMIASGVYALLLEALHWAFGYPRHPAFMAFLKDFAALLCVVIAYLLAFEVIPYREPLQTTVY